MVSIIEVDFAFPISEFHQLTDDLLPDAAALIFQQPPMASTPGGLDVMWQIFLTTPRGQDIQYAIDDFSVIVTRSPCVSIQRQ